MLINISDGVTRITRIDNFKIVTIRINPFYLVYIVWSYFAYYFWGMRCDKNCKIIIFTN